jgi:hypothetical protein
VSTVCLCYGPCAETGPLTEIYQVIQSQDRWPSFLMSKQTLLMWDLVLFPFQKRFKDNLLEILMFCKYLLMGLCVLVTYLLQVELMSHIYLQHVTFNWILVFLYNILSENHSHSSICNIYSPLYGSLPKNHG